MQLASALSEVHGAGLVHRDVKPSNVYIAGQPTGHEHAKLLDFGVARYIEQSLELQRITSQNAVVGTYEYMAPEQLLAQTADTRSDIYALGVVLFECLSGALPLKGSFGEMLLALAQRKRAKLREVAPSVPENLAAVVDRCLEWDADERWQKGTQIVAALMQTGLGRSMQLLDPGAMMTRPVVKDVGEGRRITVLTTVCPPEPVTQLRESANPQNRRVHARVPYVSPVRLSGAGEVVDGRIEDISIGGVLVFARKPLPVGAVVTMRMPLPTTGVVVPCSAVVRWARVRQGAGNLAGLGLNFIDPPKELVDAVNDFITHMNRNAEARASVM